MGYLVVDVQLLLIASGCSDPPDDGSGLQLLKTLRDASSARLVWDSEGLIKSHYEEMLGEQTFARQWLEELVLEKKIQSVDRIKLTKKQKNAILATGLVGEDFGRYVRTAANSPDRRLASHDTDYDKATCRQLKKQLSVRVHRAKEAAEFLSEDHSA